jgi:hypothetical protein
MTTSPSDRPPIVRAYSVEGGKRWSYRCPWCGREHKADPVAGWTVPPCHQAPGLYVEHWMAKRWRRKKAA